MEVELWPGGLGEGWNRFSLHQQKFIVGLQIVSVVVVGDKFRQMRNWWDRGAVKYFK